MADRSDAFNTDEEPLASILNGLGDGMDDPSHRAASTSDGGGGGEGEKRGHTVIVGASPFFTLDIIAFLAPSSLTAATHEVGMAGVIGWG